MNILDQFKSIPEGASHIKEWLGEGGRVVGQEVAQERADICLKCPENKLESTVTSPMASAVRFLLEIKNKAMLRVEGERSLGTCGVCSCVLRLQVHAPQDMVRAQLTDEEAKNLPDHCWKLKLQTTP